METILPILIWGGLLFLMMRFGCGAHMFGHGHKSKKPQSHEHAGPIEPARKPPSRTEELVWTAPERDDDPVCGKDVVTAEAKSTVHGGWVYYFCSRECRETFETSPYRFLGGEDRAAPPPSPVLLERHPDGGRSHA